MSGCHDLVDGRAAVGTQHGDQRLLFGAFARGRKCQVLLRESYAQKLVTA